MTKCKFDAATRASDVGSPKPTISMSSLFSHEYLVCILRSLIMFRAESHSTQSTTQRLLSLVNSQPRSGAGAGVKT